MRKELWNPARYRESSAVVALANGDIKNHAFRMGSIQPLTDEILHSYGIPPTVESLKTQTEEMEVDHDKRLGFHEAAVVEGIRSAVYTIDKAVSKATVFIDQMRRLDIQILPFYIVFNDAVWNGKSIYNKRNGNIDELLRDLEQTPDDTIMSSDAGTVVIPPNYNDFSSWEFYFSSLQIGYLDKGMLHRYREIADRPENEKISMGLRTIDALREGIVKSRNGFLQATFYRMYAGGKFEPQITRGTILNGDEVYRIQISTDSANNPLIVNGSLGMVPINDVILLSH